MEELRSTAERIRQKISKSQKSNCLIENKKLQTEAVIRVEPDLVFLERRHLEIIANQLGLSVSRIVHCSLKHRALDARRALPLFELRYLVWIDEQPKLPMTFRLNLQDVRNADPVIIVGAGPAGVFAALRLIELGFRPIIIERGKPVRERRKDIAAISKKGIVNPDSNYCFGEGGAGTFSDGKLYTRSTKRGSKERILNIFAAFGADLSILVDAHPHIGTNKLPAVVSSISKQVIDCGGEIFFGERLTELSIAGHRVTGVETARGTKLSAKAIVLATGHSARDVLGLLARQRIALEPKPFALGVRIEHPQALIDELQYGCSLRHENLPAASYALRAQADGRGVFSFCMCPGGIICPAATAPGEVVVNGWSPSKRNSRFANSGIVVEIAANDLKEFGADPIFSGIELQRLVETRAFAAGGGNLVAPAERLDCFVAGKPSATLPECSYNPGVRAASLAEVFPVGILKRLRAGIAAFEKSRPGYLSKEAIVVAAESRTSSPVRIPRDKKALMHPQIQGLFPCGEGAGYAGGIMSAAMDGERIAEGVALHLQARGK